MNKSVWTSMVLALNTLPVRLRIQLSRAAHWWLWLGEERRQIINLREQLGKDLASGAMQRTIADHYSGESEILEWQRYKSRFGDDNEPTFRNRFVLEQIRDLDFKTFVNFGCLYGWLEMELHKVGKLTYGVDRSTETKRLNEREFPGPHFVAADIFEFLRTHDVHDCMFAHINTGTYFLPKFLTSLYKLLHERGARYIVIFEPSGVSRVTGSYYPYSEALQDPVVFRGVMVTNNYPNLLKETGFRITRSEILHPPHPHSDYRSAFFLAERI